ncbi:uncharacterized protein CC84DRAFT_657203 [Paraphaeosphaeria sporulosa]|uniref:Uncharacterized protein n=1 Tax=Paraphaeosphaeria sporulosa TaxID=1460663 RepID=A0A177CKY6_9PLEO|nr:uncharacterized protein CC84DRAFT_657203 [Paraphaeosphaeria sporulosa]OAG07457.1 hypothetical protein CC84DRAFT_657203 [Paraphaeosphaeria sporulosa]
MTNWKTGGMRAVKHNVRRQSQTVAPVEGCNGASFWQARSAAARTGRGGCSCSECWQPDWMLSTVRGVQPGDSCLDSPGVMVTNADRREGPLHRQVRCVVPAVVLQGSCLRSQRSRSSSSMGHARRKKLEMVRQPQRGTSAGEERRSELEDSPGADAERASGRSS